jgi:ankyrin repeat protein
MLADNAHMTAVQDAAGRKPLLLACLQGDTDMAKMLIGEAKADVSGLRGPHTTTYQHSDIQNPLLCFTTVATVALLHCFRCHTLSHAIASL